MNSKLIYAVLFFLVIFLTGFWLNRAGRPYSTALLNVHKLVGLAAGVWLVVMVYRFQRIASLSPTGITAAVVSVVIFVFLIVTGGLVSAMKQVPQFVSMIHHVLPYLVVLSSGITIYLLA